MRMRFGRITGCVIIIFAVCFAACVARADEPNEKPLEAKKSEARKEAVEIEAARPAAGPVAVVSDGKSNGDKQESPAVIELAKAQLRGDFYQDALDKLNVAFWTGIATMVTLFTAFAVYLGFKNTKAYKEAVADVKEARKEARAASDKAGGYEEEAQEKLASIDKLVEEKLEQIKQEAEKQRKAGEEEAKKQRETSRKEAEKRNSIYKLWDKGVSANKAGDHESEVRCWEQAVEIFEGESFEFFSKEQRAGIYYNWGVGLSDLAKLKQDDEAEKLYRQAFEKYAKALEIKKDLHEAYSNWGTTLSALAQNKTGEEQKRLFEEAQEKCLKAESIKTGSGSYNLACVYALQKGEEQCRKWLTVGEDAGTLQTREYAEKDSELDSMRDKDWFKKIRWKGEN